MKKSCKFLVLALILSMIVSTQCFGQTINDSKSISTTNTTEFIQSTTIPNIIINFTKDKFQMFLQNVKNVPELYGLSSNEANSLYLGQGFSVFNLENNKTSNIYYFPVLFDKKIKEIFTVALNDDGTLSATLGKDFSENLESISTKSTKDNPLVILSYKGFLIAKNTYGTTKLSDICISSNHSIDENNLNKILSTQKIDVKSVNTVDVKNILPTAQKSINMQTSTSYDWRYLQVPIVTQRTSDGVQHGMCWAASVASIVNYKLGENITAADVCNLMNIGYDTGANGNTASLALNIYGVSSYAVGSPISFQQVTSYINNNKPVYMRSTSNIGNHATVINGWITSSDGNALLLMDPAYECYKQAYSSGNTFYFIFGNTTMTWYATVCLV